MRASFLRRAERRRSLLPLLLVLALCVLIGSAIAAPAPLCVGQLVAVDLAGQAHCMRVSSIDAYSGTAWLVYAGDPPQWVARLPLAVLGAPCLR